MALVIECIWPRHIHSSRSLSLNEFMLRRPLNTISSDLCISYSFFVVVVSNGTFAVFMHASSLCVCVSAHFHLVVLYDAFVMHRQNHCCKRIQSILSTFIRWTQSTAQIYTDTQHRISSIDTILKSI